MGYVNDQRILTQKRIETILEKNLPMERDKAVSLIMYELGLGKQKAREHIKVLFDLNIIGYNKDRLLIWKKNN